MKSPQRGEVWLVDLGMAAKVRPAVAISVPVDDSDRALVTMVPMDIGVEYLVFPSIRAGEPMMVDSCGNSGLVSETGLAIDTLRHLSKIRR